MSTPLEKVEDLWFLDGNIFIRVGNNVCRVYQGFLASQSSVLSDMFAMPQPPEGANMLGGHPVMAFPDAPEEVTHWLRAMMLPGNFGSYPHKVTADQLLAVLRLSHKYDVQHLRRRALEHLAGLLPVDLDKIKAKGRDSTVNASLHDLDLSLYPRINAIVHEVGALWLVPALLYELHGQVQACYLDFIAEMPYPLTTQLIIRLYKIAQLTSHHFSVARLVTHGTLCKRSPPCGATENGDLCGSAAMLHHEPLTYYSCADYYVDGVHYVDSQGHAYEGDADFCEACSQAMRARHTRACSKFWDELPESLGLPQWKDLLAAKASDLGDDAE
ncbi:hypothetical protein BD626DRAFT_636017 [Schizophyllum amplum]|uniref:BTB domain-containing protein n=1 Tax=Schizophyllum amplum TaxID=97359 RepID=A0A550BUL6_9AGAR|nr:hypothetical protein BD626DRAFT_636017 [Auriculariopsis ampla]